MAHIAYFPGGAFRYSPFGGAAVQPVVQLLPALPLRCQRARTAARDRGNEARCAVYLGSDGHWRYLVDENALILANPYRVSPGELLAAVCQQTRDRAIPLQGQRVEAALDWRVSHSSTCLDDRCQRDGETAARRGRHRCRAY